MTRTRRRAVLLVVALVALAVGVAAVLGLFRPTPVRIGSKNFTESVVLGEVATQLAQSTGRPAVHRADLGGTQILWNALRAGSIDAYFDYTGTISHEILGDPNLTNPDDIRAALAGYGLRMSRPLGFNDTYALGMKEQVAAEKEIKTISDLRKRPELRFGFSNEFLNRADGWPGLRDRYGLPQEDVRGMDHDLAYRTLENGGIQVTDLYSTDADIRYYGLRVLQDNLGYFPKYEAVLLYRADLEERAPEAVEALLRLEGRIDNDTMVGMNARVKLGQEPESRVAADFLATRLGLASASREETVLGRLWKNTLDHLWLVFVSLAAAIVVAVPLGVLASKRPRIGQAILGATGIIQTIPSLAVLVLMIPLFGRESVGSGPAIVALFLYSLLPIVRNTYTGLRDIPPALRESALALGLPPAARLWMVELPLAAPSILAGIKTAAVINVGTATIGALIGAGGYGQPILTGLRLNNVGLILQGAIPAAVLALLVQWLFELAERRLVSKGLRLKPAS